jgi:hypothetical protein
MLLKTMRENSMITKRVEQNNQGGEPTYSVSSGNEEKKTIEGTKKIPVSRHLVNTKAKSRKYSDE